MSNQAGSAMKRYSGLSTSRRDSIRTVRLQQNLMAKQLAARMGVSPARISVMERDEQRGAVTLKMMQKAAEALGCEFVYALVPKSSSQAAQPGEKPKIRLDSSHLRENPDQQRLDLQQEYRRSLRDNGKT